MFVNLCSETKVNKTVGASWYQGLQTHSETNKWKSIIDSLFDTAH